MIRHATAIWNGSGKEGSGNITTQSKVLDKTPYSFGARFEEAQGTNPEELIAAAHSGCFTMKLSFVLNENGFTADEIHTECKVTFENMKVSKSHLIVKAKVPGIENDAFQKMVTEAEKTCPISVLLHTEISSEATLI